MGKLAPRALHRIITVEDYWHCQEAGLLKRRINREKAHRRDGLEKESECYKVRT